jgi:hypothetical protein
VKERRNVDEILDGFSRISIFAQKVKMKKLNKIKIDGLKMHNFETVPHGSVCWTLPPFSTKSPTNGSGKREAWRCLPKNHLSSSPSPTSL